jgi:antitoxin component of MazEF toxin-antitoxin module
MLKKKIMTLVNSAAVVLPKDILKLPDFQAGDEIEMKVEDKSITLRPVSESIN